MRINSDLGYRPVTYSELTGDDKFWEGCKSCVNYPILMSKGRKNCLCTAMLYDPLKEERKKKAGQQQPATGNNRKQGEKKRRDFKGNFKLFERWMRYKRYVLLKNVRKPEKRKVSTTKKKKFIFY